MHRSHSMTNTLTMFNDVLGYRILYGGKFRLGEMELDAMQGAIYRDVAHLRSNKQEQIMSSCQSNELVGRSTWDMYREYLIEANPEWAKQTVLNASI